MYLLKPNQIERVLCLGAHPDDIEIGCGGTILSLLEAHPRVHMEWVVFSATEVRKHEAEASFNDFCGSYPQCRLTLFDFPDAHFPWHGQAMKETLRKIAKEFNPDLIFTTRRKDLHQDHQTLGTLTWKTFRNHWIWEYEIPKYDGDLGRPNVYVPISAPMAERKLDLLMKHFPSQQSRHWYRRSTFQSVLHLRAIETNARSGFAEGFYVDKSCIVFPRNE